MRWRGNRQSRNVEDRRGMRSPGFGGGFGGGGMLRLLPMAFKFFGLKGGLIALLAIGAYALYSGNLGGILGGSAPQENPKQSEQPIQQSNKEKELVSFVSVILADTEDTWKVLYQQQGKIYKEPRLVLFRGFVRSACGFGQSATGPFYCPSDHKVYIDLSFFDDLRTRFKAPGDFAQAYVIAHEVGHHVQALEGTIQKVHSARARLPQKEANQVLVRLELQADCYAGVWAHHAHRARQLLEKGDIEEGLAAASAIGDDRIQKQTRGYVTPDSFTHGSSAQRVRWFKTGLQQGTVAACDTFSARSL